MMRQFLMMVGAGLVTYLIVAEIEKRRSNV